MSSPAVLIATARIRPGGEDAFAAWKGRHDAAVAAFPGFNSSDIMPPGEHDDTWTILLNFDSRERPRRLAALRGPRGARGRARAR